MAAKRLVQLKKLKKKKKKKRWSRRRKFTETEECSVLVVVPRSTTTTSTAVPLGRNIKHSLNIHDKTKNTSERNNNRKAKKQSGRKQQTERNSWPTGSSLGLSWPSVAVAFVVIGNCNGPISVLDTVCKKVTPHTHTHTDFSYSNQIEIEKRILLQVLICRFWIFHYTAQWYLPTVYVFHWLTVCVAVNKILLVRSFFSFFFSPVTYLQSVIRDSAVNPNWQERLRKTIECTGHYCCCPSASCVFHRKTTDSSEAKLNENWKLQLKQQQQKVNCALVMFRSFSICPTIHQQQQQQQVHQAKNEVANE